MMMNMLHTFLSSSSGLGGSSFSLKKTNKNMDEKTFVGHQLSLLSSRQIISARSEQLVLLFLSWMIKPRTNLIGLRDTLIFLSKNYINLFLTQIIFNEIRLF